MGQDTYWNTGVSVACDFKSENAQLIQRMIHDLSDRVEIYLQHPRSKQIFTVHVGDSEPFTVHIDEKFKRAVYDQEWDAAYDALGSSAYRLIFFKSLAQGYARNISRMAAPWVFDDSENLNALAFASALQDAVSMFKQAQVAEDQIVIGHTIMDG